MKITKGQLKQIIREAMSRHAAPMFTWHEVDGQTDVHGQSTVMSTGTFEDFIDGSTIDPRQEANVQRALARMRVGQGMHFNMDPDYIDLTDPDSPKSVYVKRIS